jgi:gamma-glutamyltranspeptidase/glutathione hydrolase
MRSSASRSIALIVALISTLIVPRAGAVYPPPVTAQHGMVVTAQHLATQVGVDILKQGGNAVDAAVAVGYALAVVHPCCGNIGGGGFMLVHLADGGNTFLNFREKAPLKATRDMYLDQQGNVIAGASTDTYLAVGVPGTVLGLDTALQKYGTMSREQVMAPAIKLARDGFVLTDGDIAILDRRQEKLSREPNVKAIFLKDGQPYQPGDRLVQEDLAHSLELIERDGPKAFYDGPIAQAVVEASEANGGLLSLDDFNSYNVEWEDPVGCGYRGYKVLSSPPPSSGGTTVCEILNVLAGYPMRFMGFHSAQSVHYMVEAMRHAYVDRNTQLGDPDFVSNPLDKLLSAQHADDIRAAIDPYLSTPSSTLGPKNLLQEGNDTTQYSIVDVDGNAVSVTYTINYLFGTGKIAGDTGFFLNNEMDDFTSKPGVPNSYGLVQGEANAIAPGKRPLSSMSPTIALNGQDKVYMVTGSPGGSRIITITLETLLNVIDHGMDIQAAVDAPRIHMQWLPDTVFIEPGALSADTREKLSSMGYRFTEHEPWGADEAILVDPETGQLHGANDDRRPAGMALGY